MRKAVIFGGGGFIGSTYYEQFADEYDEVTIVDRFHGASHSSLAEYVRIRAAMRPHDLLLTADVLEAKNWPQIFRSATDVFLLNADTGTGNSFAQPSVTVGENLGKLAAIIEAIRAHCSVDQTRILFTSSRAVYGEGHWTCAEHGRQVLDRSATAMSEKRFAPHCPQCGAALDLNGSLESDAHAPLSVYGLTKAAGEKLLELTLCASGFDVRIVRYQNVYGIGQAIDNPYTGVLNWFSQTLIEEADVTIYEGGHIVRDFIFVTDAAALLHQIASAPPASGPRYAPLVFNGGTGVPTRLADAAILLRELYQSGSAIRNTDQYRPGDVLGAVAGMDRTSSELNFQAKVGLREGLSRYAEWFRVQHASRA
jgi:dTDP-L-rhamnose 4-epimerase